MSSNKLAELGETPPLEYSDTIPLSLSELKTLHELAEMQAGNMLECAAANEAVRLCNYLDSYIKLWEGRYVGSSVQHPA